MHTGLRVFRGDTSLLFGEGFDPASMNNWPQRPYPIASCERIFVLCQLDADAIRYCARRRRRIQSARPRLPIPIAPDGHSPQPLTCVDLEHSSATSSGTLTLARRSARSARRRCTLNSAGKMRRIKISEMRDLLQRGVDSAIDELRRRCELQAAVGAPPGTIEPTGRARRPTPARKGVKMPL